MSDGRLKVVHVISDAHTNRYFADLLATHGSDVELLFVSVAGAGDLQQQMAALGASAFALGASRRRDLAPAAGRLARWLFRYRPLVVQAHLPEGALVGLAAARLARVPVRVFTAHHSHELPYHGWRLRLADRICAGPLATAVIAPSRSVADTLSSLAHVPPGKVTVIPHGFDLTAFADAARHRDAIRTELGLSAHDVAIFTVGREFWLKNLPTLLDAFADVAGENSFGNGANARLFMLGQGDRTALLRQAADRGVADRVTALGFRNDLPRLLAAGDLLLHGALAESFGQVLVEALAAGVPVVSTPVGIALDVIETGATGVLAAGPRRDQIADALRTALDSRSRWPAFADAGRARAQEFTRARMAQRYEQLYRSELARVAISS